MKLDLTTSHIADASILTDTYNSLPTIEQAASSITDHAFISVLDNLGYLFSLIISRTTLVYDCFINTIIYVNVN